MAKRGPKPRRRRVLRRRRAAPKRRRSGGRRKKIHAKAKGILNKSWGKISTTLGGLAFFQQLTEADMQSARSGDITTKAKTFINSVTGRLFGVGVVPDTPTPPQTFNFGGIFNKWTGLGAGLWLLGHVPIGIPHKAKAKTLGKNLLTGGILGGFFSPHQSSHGSHLTRTISQPSGISVSTQ